jgi:NitT/TauT family transport system permease protein
MQDTSPKETSQDTSTSVSKAENQSPEDQSSRDKIPVENVTPPVVVAGAHSDDALRVGDRKNGHEGLARQIANIFLPNRALSPVVLTALIVVEALLALFLWSIQPYEVLPRPGEVVGALTNLWATQGLGQELATSFKLNLIALALATVVSLGLSYLTVIPLFRPIVAAISKGRFLSLAGFSLIGTLVLGGGRPVAVAMLTFTITVFYITSMAAVIAAIPKSDFDYARTLRMSEWRVVWEVVILGTADKAFEVLRQNAAIGWMMLTMVEGYVRADGGVGVFLLNQQKYMRLADVFAIQLLILIVGILQDYGIGILRRLACPYADLTLERK